MYAQQGQGLALDFGRRLRYGTVPERGSVQSGDEIAWGAEEPLGEDEWDGRVLGYIFLKNVFVRGRF